MRACVFLLVLAACNFSLSFVPAGAAVRFTKGEGDQGIRFVIVEGEFDYQDNLGNFSSLVESYKPHLISFNSGGGNVAKAMELGRLIRRLKLSTVQLRSSECASACALAFLGGEVRLAEPGSIGVHKSSFSSGQQLDAETAVSAVQQMTADVISYLIEMGVDPALLQLSLRYDSDDIRYLSRSEMEQFRVVAYPPVEPDTGQSQQSVVRDIPEPKSGRIRHPKGWATLKQQDDVGSPTIANLPNATQLVILDTEGRWYRARAGNKTGYLHDTWVYVDQFHQGPFEARYIQIKSFEDRSNAEAYVKSSTIPVSAFLANNGWFAITLRTTLEEGEAREMAQKMKASNQIPADSFVTFGNTYVEKVCCE